MAARNVPGVEGNESGLWADPGTDEIPLHPVRVEIPVQLQVSQRLLQNVTRKLLGRRTSSLRLDRGRNLDHWLFDRVSIEVFA